ncbi:hypothetical protein BHE74_00021711 [Ensete ventricosum]|nr:hypothetical protein BHE74_00021711 [Ensete ventricosum]
MMPCVGFTLLLRQVGHSYVKSAMPTPDVSGDGFMARDLTFANTVGPGNPQAVAFLSDSDLSVLDSTSPATSLPSSTFVFGNSVIVFRDHLIFVLPRQLNPEHDESNTVTAHDRTDPAQSTDFVFDHCTINRSDEYLGMPWKEYSRAVFIDCNSAEIVRPEGWLPWTSDFTLHTLFYGEFGSSSPGANAITRVSWSSQISTEHLGAYPMENLVQNGINGYPLGATASTSVSESLTISREFDVSESLIISRKFVKN